MSIEEFIKNITKEDLDKINEEFAKKENKKAYQYSKIKEIDLRNIVKLEEDFKDDIFNLWFNNKIEINNDTEEFLNTLINENKNLISSYNEEDLKMKFIAPLLYKINFKSVENKFRDFYETQLTYDSDDFILTGTTDFLISKGLKYPEKPYFFIQEFKKSKKNDDPEPQLLAELISAVELNNWKTIRGAYIVGSIWNFVILERFEKHNYQYFISQNFDSTKIEDLKGIFKNLLFVKQEIIEMIKRGD